MLEFKHRPMHKQYIRGKVLLDQFSNLLEIKYR